jgi:hypothetical protein
MRRWGLGGGDGGDGGEKECRMLGWGTVGEGGETPRGKGKWKGGC